MVVHPNPITHSTMQLPTKPTSNLSYTFYPGSQSTNTLVLFLNGLILPQSSWSPTILALQTKALDTRIAQLHLLSYDRYGQGTSDPHPNGTHDILDVVSDLHTFLTLFCSQELHTTVSELQIMLVCNSIGCAIARLYANAYPTTISVIIFLDSIMANVDLVDLWPDVDAPGFDESTLPEDATVEEIRLVRGQYKQRFHVSAPNPEGLDRSNLASLLSHANGPVLSGKPYLTVVGHDPETFAQENEVWGILTNSKKSFGVRKELVMEYINPVWHQYNQGLTLLTSRERSKDPIIAKGCGHFIQRDDLEFVATGICDMLQQMEEHK
ncbi:alpha/beta-hydrolase [Aureobasidium sp. EXF-8845]|nr:alpha/beta-hydrolase [Aureobasidium sp. EXF-8845]KAI4849899.1 alpha/beta-hydrolase [Aureobasidium sp. EXF-8846]